MLSRKSGKIVNTTSVNVLKGFPTTSMYATAKSGIVGFSQVLANEVAASGINVNCIAPGGHRSELGHDMPRPDTPPDPEQMKAMQEMMGKYIEDVPLRGGADAEDLAGLAVLLASDASSYITGQIITQNGGRSAKH